MIGTDPEFFIMADDNIIPAVMVLPTVMNTPYGYLRADGIPFECNPYPGNSPKVVEAVRCLTEIALSYVRKEIGGNVKIIFAPSVKVSKELIAMSGAFDASALQFGCSPDKSIYDEHPSYRGDASQIFYRFAGTHIHIDAPPQSIKVLDRILGLVINEEAKNIKTQGNVIGGVEGEVLRRQYYGRAGVYREKRYGSEWRVPSSAILNDFGKYLEAAEKIAENWRKYDKFPLSEEETKEIINAGLTYEDAWNYI